MSPSTASPRRRIYLTDEQRALLTTKYPYYGRSREGFALLQAQLGGMSATRLYNHASHSGASRVEAFELTFDPASRWRLRDEPAHTDFSKLEDDYLRAVWPRAGNSRSVRLEAIALMLDRTETAVAHRARQLGLRNVARYYDAERVRAWLELRRPTADDPDALDELAVLDRVSYGLVHPCTDLRGRVVSTLVSTSALYRLLLEADEPDRAQQDLATKVRRQLMRRILARRIDKFFLLEVREGMAEVIAGRARFEPSAWISHGMTDLCPLSAGYGGFLYAPHAEPVLEVGALGVAELHPDERIADPAWKPSARRDERYRLGRDPRVELGLPASLTL